MPITSLSHLVPVRRVQELLGRPVGAAAPDARVAEATPSATAAADVVRGVRELGLRGVMTSNGVQRTGPALEDAATGSRFILDDASRVRYPILPGARIAGTTREHLAQLVVGQRFDVPGTDPLGLRSLAPPGSKVLRNPDNPDEAITVVRYDGGDVHLLDADGTALDPVPRRKLLEMVRNDELGGRAFATSSGRDLHVVSAMDDQLVVSWDGPDGLPLLMGMDEFRAAVGKFEVPSTELEVIGRLDTRLHVREGAGAENDWHSMELEELEQLVPDLQAQLLRRAARPAPAPELLPARSTRIVTSGSQYPDGHWQIPRRFARADDVRPNPSLASLPPEVSWQVPERGELPVIVPMHSLEQGALGDCRLLSELDGLVAANPEVAHGMVSLRADGNVDVRVGQRVITVTPELPYYDGQLVGAGANGHLSAAYVEKAFASEFPEGYAKLDFIDGRLVTGFLRGQDTATLPELHVASARISGEPISVHVEREFARPTDTVRTVGTGRQEVDSPEHERLLEQFGLITRHAYNAVQVVHPAEGGAQLLLRNPHGGPDAFIRVPMAAVDDVFSRFSAGPREVFGPLLRARDEPTAG